MAGPIRGVQKLTEEDVARAMGLTRSGLAPDVVRSRLIDGGMDPGIADHAIQVVGERQLMAESFDMLSNGQRPDAVVQFLVGRGVTLFTAQEVVQGHLYKLQSMRPPGAGAVVRRVIGVALILGGIAMLFNPAGFRFIGFIMILIGMSMMGW